MRKRVLSLLLALVMLLGLLPSAALAAPVGDERPETPLGEDCVLAPGVPVEQLDSSASWNADAEGLPLSAEAEPSKLPADEDAPATLMADASAISITLASTGSCRSHHGDNWDAFGINDGDHNRASYDGGTVEVRSSGNSLTIYTKERDHFKRADYLYMPFTLSAQVPAHSRVTYDFTITLSHKRNSKGGVHYWLELLDPSKIGGASLNTSNNTIPSPGSLGLRIKHDNKDGGSGTFSWSVTFDNYEGATAKKVDRQLAYWVGACKSTSALTSYHHQVESSATFAVKNTTVTKRVKYDPSDGYILYTLNSSFTTRSAPTKTGYTFTGWKDADSSRVYNGGQSYSISSGLNLVAQWTAKALDVTFDPNGGSGKASKTVTYGQTYGTLPDNPVRTGYQFVGWYTAATGGAKVDTTTKVTQTDNHTLYAHWAVKTPTVTFSANGGSVSTSSKGVTYNAAYGSLPTPTRTGYAFDGWYTAQTGGTKVESTTKVANGENHTLYAHWTVKTPTVTLNVNGGSALSDSDKARTVTYGGAYGALPTPTRQNYAFTGWYTSASGGSRVESSTKVTNANAHTLYAHWSRNTYTITFNANGGSAVEARQVNAGDKLGALPTSTRTGYTLSGWSTAATGGSQVTAGTVPAASATYYAQWTAKTCTVSYNAAGGAFSGAAGKTVAYDSTYGDLPIPTRQGYTFGGWYTDPTDGTQVTASTKVTQTDNHTLYAHWTAMAPTVTFDPNGGSVSTSSKSVTYDQTYGELPTPTRTGYAFGGWYTAPTGGTKVTASTKVAQTADHTLYARWMAKTMTVTFDANGGSVDTASKAVTYGQPYGALPVPTHPEGKVFRAWYDASSGGNFRDASSLVTKDADHTLYARWETNHTHRLGAAEFGDKKFSALGQTADSGNNIAAADTVLGTTLTTSQTCFLATDVPSISRVTIIPSGVTLNLCLNGHKLAYTGAGNSAFVVEDGGRLNICDCNNSNGTHTITDPATSKSVTISGGLVTGGAVQVKEGGAFNLHSGTIAGNDGGAVQANGTFHMYGGELCHNASSGNGGAVLVGSGGTLALGGGSITDNTAQAGGASNVYLSDGATLTIGQSFAPAQPVGVSTQTTPTKDAPVSFGGEGSGAFAQYFVADVSGQNVYAGEDGKLYLGVHAHPVCGASCDHGGEHADVTYTALTQTMLDVGTLSAGSYMLTEDLAFTADLTISSGPVDLCLNGHKLSCNSNKKLIVKSGVELNICDCQGGGIISSRGTVIENQGTVSLFSGEVNSSSSYGISNWSGNTSSFAVLNVFGGTIFGSTNGINNYRAIVNMTGGTISSRSSAVLNGNSTTFTMSGGTISGTNSNGMYNDGSSDVTITISGGTVTGGQNGIYCYNSGQVVNVTGGTISGTTGIRNSSGSSVHVSGGTVTGTEYGVYSTSSSYQSSQVTVSGGTVYGLQCGVYNYGNGSVTVSGDALVTSDSAGIVATGGTVEMTGGTIAVDGDYSSGIQGNAGSGSPCTVNMTGGTVTVNGARSYGINNTNATLTVSGGAISNTKGYAGIYNADAQTATVTGGTITGSGYGIQNGGTLALGGDPSIQGADGDISLCQLSSDSSGKITVQEDGLNGTYSVLYESGTVSETSPYTFTTAAGADHSAHFTAAQADQGVWGVFDKPYGTYTAQLYKKHFHDGEDEGFAPIPTTGAWVEEEHETLTSGHYFLTGSTQANTGALTVPAGATVDLCLNGQQLIDTQIKVEGTLNLCDCKDGSGISTSLSPIVVGETGVLNYYSGELTSTRDEPPIFADGEVHLYATPDISPSGNSRYEYELRGNTPGFLHIEAPLPQPEMPLRVNFGLNEAVNITTHKQVSVTTGWAEHMGEAEVANYFAPGKDRHAKVEQSGDELILRLYQITQVDPENDDEVIAVYYPDYNTGKLPAGTLSQQNSHPGKLFEGWLLRDDYGNLAVDDDYAFNDDGVVFPRWLLCDHSGNTAESTVVKATCTEDGYTSYTCSVCGLEVVETTEALGHDFDTDTTWHVDEEGGVHYHKCSRCDQRQDEAEHTWDDGAVTTEPTVEAEGEMTFACTQEGCPATTTAAIPKLVTHTVTYEVDAHTNEAAPTQAPVLKSETVTLPADGLTRTGYTLSGWALLDADGVPTVDENGKEVLYTGTFTMPDRDVTFQVRWSRIDNYQLQPGDTIVLPDGTVIKNETDNTVTIDQNGDGDPETTITLPGGGSVTIQEGQDGGQDKVVVPPGAEVTTTPGEGGQGPVITIGNGDGTVDPSGKVEAPVGTTITDQDGNTITITEGTGGTIDPDGVVTFPEGGGGKVTVTDKGGNTTEVDVPGGGDGLDVTPGGVPLINNPDGSLTIPDGQGGSTTVTVPDGDDGAGSAEVDDKGNIILPGGSTVTKTDGEGNQTDVTVPDQGGAVTPDGDVGPRRPDRELFAVTDIDPEHVTGSITISADADKMEWRKVTDPESDWTDVGKTATATLDDLDEGSYEFRYKAESGLDASLPREIRVNNNPQGGKALNIDPNITGGTVSAVRTRVKPGLEVRLTVKANTGYRLASITATYGEGQSLTPVWTTNTLSYNFIMPDADVTVTATFVSTTPPTPGHTHAWAGDWTTSATHHWHECTADGCSVTQNKDKDGYGAHLYDNDQDKTCNTCGYTRTVVKPDPDTFLVTFDPQGGKPIPADQNVVKGKLAAKPAAPAKDGFTFRGWFTQADGGKPWQFNVYTVNEDTTLYALWTAKRPGVTVTPEDPVNIPGGGTVTKDPDTGDVTITPPEDDPSGTTTTITPGDNGDVTVDPDTGEVSVPAGSTVDPGNGAKVELPDGGKVDSKGNITLPDGGEAVTVPDGEGSPTTITAPDGGGDIKPTEDGGLEIPGGSTVKTGEDGPEVTVPDEGGKVSGDGTVTVPGGSTVIIPDGNGGKTEITVPDGGEADITPTEDGKVEVPGGSTVKTGEDGPEVTVPDEGGKVSGDGTVTVPGGSTVTIPDGKGGKTEITVPDGGEADIKPTEDGKVAVPGGSTVKTGEDGPEVTVPDEGGKVSGDGTVTVPGGSTVTIPDGKGGKTEITVPDGGEADITPTEDGKVKVPGGSTVKTGEDGPEVTVPDEGGKVSGDGTVTVPGGSTVTIPDGNGGKTEITVPKGGEADIKPTEDGKVKVPEGAIVTKPDGSTVTAPSGGGIIDPATGNVTPVKPEDPTPSQPTRRPSRRPTRGEEPKTEEPKATVDHFADVKPGDWFYDSVKAVVEQGLMNGTGQTTFAPDMDTSRAMIATIIWRLADSPEPKAALTYPDCVADSWYAKAVAWCSEQGVVKGYSDGNFGPDDPITREQLAAMLYRYASSPATRSTLDSFTDADQAGSWAMDALCWAVEKGILTGKGGGVLDPIGLATRAEAAAMLTRFCESEK